MAQVVRLPNMHEAYAAAVLPLAGRGTAAGGAGRPGKADLGASECSAVLMLRGSGLGAPSALASVPKFRPPTVAELRKSQGARMASAAVVVDVPYFGGNQDVDWGRHRSSLGWSVQGDVFEGRVEESHILEAFGEELMLELDK